MRGLRAKRVRVVKIKAGPFLILPHFLRINYWREKQLDSRPGAFMVDRIVLSSASCQRSYMLLPSCLRSRHPMHLRI